jgi:hypothetical protein
MYTGCVFFANTSDHIGDGTYFEINKCVYVCVHQWRRIAQEAKADVGLQHQVMMMMCVQV